MHNDNTHFFSCGGASIIIDNNGNPTCPHPFKSIAKAIRELTHK